MARCEVCGNSVIPGSGACLVCMGISDKDGNFKGGKGRERKLPFGTLASFRNRFEENYSSVPSEIQQRIDDWSGMDRNVIRSKEEKDRLRRIGESIWRAICNHLDIPFETS